MPCLKRNSSFIEFRTSKQLPNNLPKGLLHPKPLSSYHVSSPQEKKKDGFTHYLTLLSNIYPCTQRQLKSSAEKILLAIVPRKPIQGPGTSQQTLLYSKILLSRSLSLTLVKTSKYQVINEIKFYYRTVVSGNICAIVLIMRLILEL